MEVVIYWVSATIVITFNGGPIQGFVVPKTPNNYMEDPSLLIRGLIGSAHMVNIEVVWVEKHFSKSRQCWRVKGQGLYACISCPSPPFSNLPTENEGLSPDVPFQTSSVGLTQPMENSTPASVNVSVSTKVRTGSRGAPRSETTGTKRSFQLLPTRDESVESQNSRDIRRNLQADIQELRRMHEERYKAIIGSGNKLQG